MESENKKKYDNTPEELSEDLFELRNNLTKNGIELHKESFSCGKAFITVRLVLLERKVYLVKRVNRTCTKIICVNSLVSKELKKNETE